MQRLPGQRVLLGGRRASDGAFPRAAVSASRRQPAALQHGPRGPRACPHSATMKGAYNRRWVWRGAHTHLTRGAARRAPPQTAAAALPCPAPCPCSTRRRRRRCRPAVSPSTLPVLPDTCFTTLHPPNPPSGAMGRGKWDAHASGSSDGEVGGDGGRASGYATLDCGLCHHPVAVDKEEHIAGEGWWGLVGEAEMLAWSQTSAACLAAAARARRCCAGPRDACLPLLRPCAGECTKCNRIPLHTPCVQEVRSGWSAGRAGRERQ